MATTDYVRMVEVTCDDEDEVSPDILDSPTDENNGGGLKNILPQLSSFRISSAERVCPLQLLSARQRACKYATYILLNVYAWMDLTECTDAPVTTNVP